MQKDITTLDDIKNVYDNSKYPLKIYALFPPQFRSNLIEDDKRIDYCYDILNFIVDEKPLVNKLGKTHKIIADYYKNYTKEAAKYIMDAIDAMYLSYENGEYMDIKNNNMPPRIPLSPMLQAIIRGEIKIPFVSSSH